MSVESAHADMAPEPEVELGGLQPPQFKPTEVAMLYERVEMELGMFYDETAINPIQNRVTVNAYFVMQNQGTVDESMKAVFPSQSAPHCHGAGSGNTFTVYDIEQDTFQVVVDGVTIPTFELEAPYADCSDYPWLAFDVTFPVNKEILVKISYSMKTWNVDFAQNINYILETGAGWKGKIGRGYIILKFPYTVTSENVLSTTTKGYQSVYNEIFWSFQDLEPTSKDNIQISIVSPNVWLDILRLRHQLAETADAPRVWLDLITKYGGIAYSNKGTFTRDQHYADLIGSAYEQAIAANPNNAELFLSYAADKLFGWSPYGEPINDAQARQILPLLSKALALEPDNADAAYVLSRLQVAAPFITFTIPPTIPPTATSPFTATPSITPTVTITPIPSETPFVVTVIQTKLVKAPTSTPDAKPTLTTYPTLTEMPVTTQTESNSSALVFGALAIFAVGAGSGWLLSKRQKK